MAAITFKTVKSKFTENNIKGALGVACVVAMFGSAAEDWVNSSTRQNFCEKKAEELKDEIAAQKEMAAMSGMEIKLTYVGSKEEMPSWPLLGRSRVCTFN